LYGKLTADGIENIVVVKDENDRWWVQQGNRRLFTFKMLERYYLPFKITVIVDDVMPRKTTKTKGKTITVRGCPNLDVELQQLSEKYRGKRTGELTSANDELNPEEHVDYDYPCSQYDEAIDKIQKRRRRRGRIFVNGCSIVVPACSFHASYYI
jgi:hypothetical protein